MTIIIGNCIYIFFDEYKGYDTLTKFLFLMPYVSLNEGIICSEIFGKNFHYKTIIINSLLLKIRYCLQLKRKLLLIKIYESRKYNFRLKFDLDNININDIIVINSKKIIFNI